MAPMSNPVGIRTVPVSCFEYIDR